jgi:MYXO-CTERM domain-containing protein
MFGQNPSPFFSDVDGSFMGDQVRGFGFLHDGSTSGVFNFLSTTVFDLDAGEQRNLEAAIMAFESDLAPIVGQQITLSSTSGPDVDGRIDLLIERASTPFVMPGQTAPLTECELIVKGIVGGEARGWTLQSDGSFLSDRSAEPPWTAGALRALANTAAQPLTFTCVPPGSGFRMGVNRDRDALRDGDDAVPDQVQVFRVSCSAGRTAARSDAYWWMLALIALVARRRRWPS